MMAMFNLGDILKKVEEELEAVGVSVNIGGDVAGCFDDSGDAKVKVVCVAPGLRDSVEEMGKSPRDRVVMVRVDSESSAALDAWVETGALKSRSEAAALFIHEGLKVRADELERLRDALGDVEAARERLREQARQVFGGEEKAE